MHGIEERPFREPFEIQRESGESFEGKELQPLKLLDRFDEKISALPDQLAIELVIFGNVVAGRCRAVRGLEDESGVGLLVGLEEDEELRTHYWTDRPFIRQPFCQLVGDLYETASWRCFSATGIYVLLEDQKATLFTVCGDDKQLPASAG